MKKELIFRALTGIVISAIVTSAYGADVRLGGRIQSEYSAIDIEGFSTQTAIDDPTFYSSFGLKVSESLGNGIKVHALIDYGFNLSGSIGAARERYVGLTSDSWGEIKLGRVHSLFADYIGGWTIDPFVYTALQATGSGGTMIGSANGLGSGSFTAVNSVIRIESITVNGFSLAAFLMPGDSNRLDPVTGNGDLANTGGEDGEWDFQVAAKYAFDYQKHNFDLFGGYSRDNVSSAQKNATTVNLKNENVWRGGGVWSYKNFQLQGQYDYIDNAVGAATCSDAAALGAVGETTRRCNSAINPGGNGSVWFTSGQYKLGNTTLIAQGGMTDANSTNVFASRKAKSYTVGAFHHLSQRTSLFTGYQHVNVKDKNSTVDRDSNIWTAGIRHNFY
jgi:general bacterial porin, GBP family